MGYSRLMVSCPPDKATLLMTAKMMGDYNVRVERFVPCVFQKGIVYSVDVDLSDKELSGGFYDH